MSDDTDRKELESTAWLAGYISASAEEAPTEEQWKTIRYWASWRPIHFGRRHKADEADQN